MSHKKSAEFWMVILPNFRAAMALMSVVCQNEGYCHLVVKVQTITIKCGITDIKYFKNLYLKFKFITRGDSLYYGIRMTVFPSNS